MNLKLDRIEVFVTVVENGSFSAAARKLKISVPAVSKQIAELESQLQTLLLERTTRRVSLTEAGEIYYEQCKRLMDEVLETESISTRWSLEPSGILRVFSARYYGQKMVLPYLKEFQDLYPKLRLDLELGERVPDPSQEDLDLILGISMAGPDLWIQKKIGTTRYALTASPEYLNTHGIPKKPHDLTHHFYITHKMRNLESQIEFETGEKVKIVPSLILNDTEAMLQCALDGLGIVKLHHYVVDRAIQSGKLVEVLGQFLKPEIPIYLYYPPRRFLQSKVKKFMEFFLKKPIL